MPVSRSLSLLITVACATGAVAASLGAQDSTTAARSLRVFIDCNADCDEDYLRTESPWVDFVRDRADADVHLLITSLETGAGGEQYTINLVGLGAFGGRSDTLRFVFHAGETDDVGRRGLTRTIQLGLAPFVARTAVATRLRMTLDEAAAPGAGAAVPADDPWNAWVFDLDANAFFESEERQSELEWGGSVDASRITPSWKFGASVDASFDESHFVLEDDEAAGGERKITTLREAYSGGAVLVRSLGNHWGAGMQLSVGASTFDNTKVAVRAASAVEYNLFSYDDFTRRQLTLQYSIGVSAFQYRETTIFGRLRETRPTHALVVGYDVTQRWGEADVTLETARYLDNTSQWRLDFNGEVDVRVLRGLSIELGGGASLIRDQLSIAARDATPEEILLELRDLLTDYRYDLRVGVSYTFGSIFNTIVNPRFGTGPGDVLR